MVVLYMAEHTPLLFTAATISSRVIDPPGGKQLEPSELRQPSSFVDELRNSLPNNADGVAGTGPPTRLALPARVNAGRVIPQVKFTLCTYVVVPRELSHTIAAGKCLASSASPNTPPRPQRRPAKSAA
jgi:hypothetical protein